MADHDKAVALFTQEANSGSDSETKAWAAKTLPTLKAHQAEAKTLAAGLKTKP